MSKTTTSNPLTTHERCRIAPPTDGAAAAQSLPLTFFDMVWLHFTPTQRLLFYQFPCSSEHFLQTIIPNIKKSLSQTLRHYLPLVGNLIYPLNSETFPELRYVPGDSIFFTVAESNEPSEFNYLTRNQPRVADEFYALVPDLPLPKIEPECKKIPLFAVQITLFPNIGISLGFTNHHAVGDASSIVGFIKAWSSISLENAELISVPFYERSVIKDPLRLKNTFWSQMGVFKIESPPLNFPTNKLRLTYILSKNDILKLKNFVHEKKPTLTHLSSFSITTAYVWSCLVKSAARAGEQVEDDEPEYFIFAVDARRRVDPPVPAGYFGNCVAFGTVEEKHGRLKGEDGFLIAAELIGEEISKKVNNKAEILKDAEKWMSKFGSLGSKRSFGVAGSPRFDLYDTEFGWGKPMKYEVVSIDGPGSMSLCKSREYEGGLEIGLSLDKKKIDAFAGIFSDGLKI